MVATKDSQTIKESPGHVLLSGYAGAAILLDSLKSVIATNQKGSELEALLKNHSAPEITALMDQALESEQITVGNITLKNPTGDIVLDITVVPQETEGGLIVLANDLTMEKNLRSALIESRQRFKDLVEISSDFAWETGPENTFIFVSPRGALGYQADELVGQHPKDFVINADDYSPVPFLSETRIEDMELWMRHADGSIACVMISCLPLLTANGTWLGTRGICRDITEDRERESELARSRHREQLLGYIVGTIRDELEPSNMLTAASTAAAHGLSASGCSIYRKDKSSKCIVAAEYGETGDKSEIELIIEKLDNGVGDGDGIIETEIDEWRVLAASTHYRKSSNGAICIWKRVDQGSWSEDTHILIRDVASQLGIANEQITNHEHILNLSRTDAMTGLLNRRAFFEEEIPRRISRLDRNKNTASLFYVDMDNFKLVNDVHGHQMGDEAIYFLRDMLLEHSRSGDVIARLGGDEFAMWLDGMSPEAAEVRAQDLIESSRALQKFSGDDQNPLGLSIGVAMYDATIGEEVEKLVARADAAMYEIKNKGKGGYIMASEKISASTNSKTNT